MDSYTAKVYITIFLQKQHGGYVLVTPAHGISYPSTAHIRAAIRKAGLKQAGGSLPVVIDCTFIDMADYTSAKVGIYLSPITCEICFITELEFILSHFHFSSLFFS